jgi:hypothetical protein
LGVGQTPKADPAVRVLRQRYHEARQVVAYLDRAVRVVDNAGGIEPADRNWDSFRECPDCGLAAPWLEALEGDADARLPE